MTVTESEKLLQKVYDLVFSTTRQMPAYFTSANDRNKTFGIDFDELSESDEYEMASVTYNVVEHFVQGIENNFERTWIVRLGEDVMLGAFVITKLGDSNWAPELSLRIVNENTERFRDVSKDLDVDRVIKLPVVQNYLNYCIVEGVRQAETGKINKPGLSYFN